MTEPRHSHNSHHRPQDDRGQTLSEYSVLLGLLVIVVAAAVPLLGNAVRGLYQGVIGLLGG